MKNVPTFNFDSVVKSLLRKGEINPTFQKEYLASEVVVPQPKKTTDIKTQMKNEKAIKDAFSDDMTLPFSQALINQHDFKFFTGLADSTIKEMKKTLGKSITKFVVLKDLMSQTLISEFPFVDKQNHLFGANIEKVALLFSKHKKYYSDGTVLSVGEIFPFISLQKEEKTRLEYLFQFSYLQKSTHSKVAILLTIINGGLRVRFGGVTKKGKFTKDSKVDTVSIPKDFFNKTSNEMMQNIIDIVFTLLYKNGYEQKFKKTLMEMLMAKDGEIISKDDGLDDFDVSKATEGLIIPLDDVQPMEIANYPMGSIYQMGMYYIAKYDYETDVFYNILDVVNGTYTDQAFTLSNAIAYCKQKNVQPKLLLDPSQNTEIQSIISQYNFLYPPELLKSALVSLGITEPPKLSISTKKPLFNFAQGQIVYSEEMFASLPNSYSGVATLLLDSDNNAYRKTKKGNLIKQKSFNKIKFSTSSGVTGHQTKPISFSSIIKKEPRFFQFPYDEKNGYINENQKFNYLSAYNIPIADTFGDKGNIGKGLLYSQLSPSEIATRRLQHHYKVLQEQGVSEQDQMDALTNLLSTRLFLSRNGKSLGLLLNGFGAYYILIDQHNGKPFYMLQYCKQNSTYLRMVLSNNTMADGQTYWQALSTEQNGVRTATQQPPDSYKDTDIPYDDKFAFNTVEDAISMIITHLYQTIKTGFNFFEQADPTAKPQVISAVDSYIGGNENDFDISSVLVPTLLTNIACGAMLVVPKQIGVEAKVFIINQNNQWTIPAINLSVGQSINDCAKEALEDIFVNLPDLNFAGVTLSSNTDENNKPFTFHTVLIETSPACLKEWLPTVKKDQNIQGYAWVNESDLNLSKGDIVWKPTLTKNLSSKQEYTNQRGKVSITSLLQLWMEHSKDWKQGEPVDPRLKSLFSEANLEQLEKKGGLYFDGIPYEKGFLNPPESLFKNYTPDLSQELPMLQQLAGSGYNENPSKPKLVGHRKNGSENTLKYNYMGRNYLIRYNPKKAMINSINNLDLSKYKSQVKKSFGISNPSQKMLQRAYILDEAGLPLTEVKRNPKGMGSLTLSLEEARIVISFADRITDSLGTESSMTPSQVIPNAIAKSLKNRSNTSAYDPENSKASAKLDGENVSIAQILRYIPMLRMYGLWKKYFDLGSRTVLRTLDSNPSSTYGKGKSLQANVWSYAQLECMKKYFPQAINDFNVSDNLENGTNLFNACKCWISIQKGKYDNKMLVRSNTDPIWKPVPYKEPAGHNQVVSNNTTNMTKVKVPKWAVDNAYANVEGFWVGYYNFTHNMKTVAGYSTTPDWAFGAFYHKIRANTRDPRFLNQAGETGFGGSMPFSNENEICFVYTDHTPCPVEILATSDQYSNNNTHPMRISKAHVLAFMKARPPYRQIPYPKGEFSEFIKQI